MDRAAFPDDLDLDDDALLSEALEAPPAAKARPGKPKRPPRRKGEEVDRSSAEYQAELAAARLGLPRHENLTWLCAQLWDNGETAKHRWKAKLEFTDARAELCTRTGKRSIARVRSLPFSSRKQFLRNLRRKQTGKLTEYDWAIVDLMLAQFDAVDAESAALGLPPAMFGLVQCNFAGRQTYPGQYGALVWAADAGTGEVLPVVVLAQNAMMLRLEVELLPVRLRVPEGERAPRACGWVGTYYNDALQGRIAEGREVKAKRERDREERAALAERLRKGKAA